MASTRKKTALAAAALTFLVLAFTADERVFGLATDGQIMTRTAYSMAALGEIGMARGHAVNRVRPQGDAVTRYGMAPSIVQVVPMWLAGGWERTFGPGASQTLFVFEQLLWVVLAAWAAGLLAQGLSAGSAEAGWRAALLCGLASPLAGYVSSEYSEPLQSALLAGAFALAVAALREAKPRRVLLLAAGAGACAGFALVARSTMIVLLPLLAGMLLLAAAREKRVRAVAAFVAGWVPFAALWLAFELVRFGKPFGSYPGEHFSHSLASGLWRLTIGPNKGMFLYFPAALLAVLGFAKLLKRDDARLPGLAILGWVLFTLGITAAWWSWDGIGGWGPRLLIPLVPLLAAVAAVASLALPVAVFRGFFALGAVVAAIGVLQPSSLNTWYFNVLPRRVLTEAEAAKYPDFVLETDPKTGQKTLTPHADVANHAALSELRLAPWLLMTRLEGGDVMKTLRTPPWDTTRPEFRVALPPDQAIPSSALVFLTTPFRWPHLGMSLTRGRNQLDTVLAYIDSVYDQALRAQDMKDGERAIQFAEKLYQMVPNEQTATELAESYRLANRRETFAEVVQQMPPDQKKDPRFGIVMALYARDIGETQQAERFLNAVLAEVPRPDFLKLRGVPPAQWPGSLREIERKY